MLGRELGFCFFFQAEDGIRDLVRSRGLGDVYKRQVLECTELGCELLRAKCDVAVPHAVALFHMLGLEPVSYTHLTLPTSDLV